MDQIKIGRFIAKMRTYTIIKDTKLNPYYSIVS